MQIAGNVAHKSQLGPHTVRMKPTIVAITIPIIIIDAVIGLFFNASNHLSNREVADLVTPPRWLSRSFRVAISVTPACLKIYSDIPLTRKPWLPRSPCACLSPSQDSHTSPMSPRHQPSSLLPAYPAPAVACPAASAAAPRACSLRLSADPPLTGVTVTLH